MKNRIFIFHFSPLELFPPVMNFLDSLSANLKDNVEVIVYTTSLNDQKKSYNSPSERIRIKRLARFTLKLSFLRRAIQYFRYYVFGFLDAFVSKPQKILYFETISSFVPYLIFQLRKETQIYIHYHEYMNPEEYKIMWLNRIFHDFEKKIYSKSQWVSHTNEKRMELFLKDLQIGALANAHIFPNYPPAKWKNLKSNKNLELPLKLVYVGSLGSIESLYIREILKWVREQEGNLVLDLYSMNISEEVLKFVAMENSSWIRWRGAANYNELPSILQQHDIGLILYKGHSENFIYNAPNKLFEYLVCGLDVWYPKELIGAHTYDCEDWPKTLRLDFSKLNQYDLYKMTQRVAKTPRSINFTSDIGSLELINNLVN